MKSRFVSIVLTLCMVMAILPAHLPVLAESDGECPFADVNSGDWYYDSVKYVYSAGLMDGVVNNEFAPNESLTRAMFVTVLGRMAAIDTSEYSNSDFTDVENGQWYTPYIVWAANSGIVNGYGDGTFGPENAVTREDMATLVARYINNNDITLAESADILTLSAFNDTESVSDYAKEALELMRTTGIIKGDEKGNFNPQQTATRAEAAAIFMRLSEAILPESITVQNVGHGQYSITDSSLLNDDETLVAHATEDEELYELENSDKYLLEAYEDNYILADEIEIDYDDSASRQAIYDDNMLPQEIIEQVEEIIQEQKAMGNEDYEVNVYAPATDDSTESGMSALDSGNVYYSYEGYSMRAYWVKTWGASVDLDNIKGATAKQYAAAALNVALSIAGILPVSKAISYVLGGYGVVSSALAAYETLYGSVNYGYEGDSLRVKIIYDKKAKTEYVLYNGSWVARLKSHKVWLDKAEYSQYYSAKKRSYLSYYSINLEYFSTCYNSAAAIAVLYHKSVILSKPGSNISPYMDDGYITLTAKMSNKTFTLKV